MTYKIAFCKTCGHNKRLVKVLNGWKCWFCGVVEKNPKYKRSNAFTVKVGENAGLEKVINLSLPNSKTKPAISLKRKGT